MMKNTQQTRPASLPKDVDAPPAPPASPRIYGYEFYRDNFRRLTWVSMFLVSFCCVEVAGMVWLFNARGLPDVYGATRGGVLQKLATTEVPPSNVRVVEKKE